MFVSLGRILSCWDLNLGMIDDEVNFGEKVRLYAFWGGLSKGLPEVCKHDRCPVDKSEVGDWR